MFTQILMNKYNPNKKSKILIWLNDMIADVLNPYSAKSWLLVEIWSKVWSCGTTSIIKPFFENCFVLFCIFAKNTRKNWKSSRRRVQVIYQCFISSVTYHDYSRRKIYSSRLYVTKKYAKLIEVISSHLYRK